MFPPIKEHRLAFTPNNAIFQSLMDHVDGKLKLDKAIGVSDDDQLQTILVDRGLIAGIVFHHLNVS